MIAQLAYVLNLKPREASNFSTALISDMFPSLTNSKIFYRTSPPRVRISEMFPSLTSSKKSLARPT